jgi:hypothetical protein
MLVIKQRFLTVIKTSSQMFIGKFGHLTSTGSTLHKSFFYQERFVNFLNGSRIFSQSRGNGSDFAQVKGSGSIDTEIAQFALEALNIDKYGLDEIDNKILCTIIDKFKGGPVGITTIATALGEDAGTIEEVYEPFLIKEGFMKRTPRGREVTELAYKHLGRSLYNSQKTLFND